MHAQVSRQCRGPNLIVKRGLYRLHAIGFPFNLVFMREWDDGGRVPSEFGLDSIAGRLHELSALKIQRIDVQRPAYRPGLDAGEVRLPLIQKSLQFLA